MPLRTHATEKLRPEGNAVLIDQDGSNVLSQFDGLLYMGSQDSHRFPVVRKGFEV